MRITVRYPVLHGHLVLRTALDWERDVEPLEATNEGAVFEVPTSSQTVTFKPCLVRDGAFFWSQGADYTLGRFDPDAEVWPFFFAEERGRVSDVMRFERDGQAHAVRVYLPPGYDENHLRTFPVLYMQDGRNLFMPEEAFGGREWRVDETMDRLDRMYAVRKVIVVGVAPIERMRDYTRPGYGPYGDFLVGTVKPAIDRAFRTRPGPADTVVMGSSLGGVVSLQLAWQHPDVFGNAACLSSTFGYEDDLFERIEREPKRAIRLYLDSGWPRDNFDATNAMRDLLVYRGFRLGDDLLSWSFPEGGHNEDSWAHRLHLPFQFFFGRAWAASRARG